MAKQQPSTELAWAGWRTNVPPDWRPLRIDGAWADGAMVLGSSEQSVLQINWQRPPHQSFSADNRLRKWSKRVHAASSTKSPAELTHPDIKAAVRAMVKDRKSGTEHPFWCCYSARANLVVEIRTRPAITPENEQWVRQKLLPALRFSAADEPAYYAVFNGCFRAPSGFLLKNSALHSGDLAILLETTDGTRLTMRQVYPGDLALQRRDLADWLAAPPFKDVLSVKVLHGPEQIEMQFHDANRVCIKRFGKKLGNVY